MKTAAVERRYHGQMAYERTEHLISFCLVRFEHGWSHYYLPAQMKKPRLIMIYRGINAAMSFPALKDR